MIEGIDFCYKQLGHYAIIKKHTTCVSCQHCIQFILGWQLVNSHGISWRLADEEMEKYVFSLSETLLVCLYTPSIFCAKIEIAIKVNRLKITDTITYYILDLQY